MTLMFTKLISNTHKKTLLVTFAEDLLHFYEIHRIWPFVGTSMVKDAYSVLELRVPF